MNLSIFILNGEWVIISNKRNWYNSWRWKLFIVFIVVTFIPLLFFYNFTFKSVKDYYKNDAEKNCLTIANIIAGTITDENYVDSGDLEQQLNSLLQEVNAEYSVRVLVIDDQGLVLGDSNGMAMGQTYLVPEVIKALDGNSVATVHDNPSEKSAYAAVDIQDNEGKTAGAVLAVESLEPLLTITTEIQSKIILIAVVSLVLLGVIVFFVSKFLLTPVKNIMDVVQKMAEGHSNLRVVNKGKDEFSVLGSAINDMAEKLEQQEKTKEEFVANVSHELKTPLSSIKVLTESILLQEDVSPELYSEFLQDINSEIDRMNNIVNDFLHLVKLEQREDALNISVVKLNKVLEEILKRLAPLAEIKNIDLIFEEIREVTIDGDEMKLNLALMNIIENGIKYTNDGGTVTVTVNSDHQNAFITVKDTGIGISEEDQAQIFKRFYRADKTRDRETGGTGLGLSISHETILLHNGSIKVNSKIEEGTTFTVRLPIRSSI